MTAGCVRERTSFRGSSAAATAVATAPLTFGVNLFLPAKHPGITGLSGQERSFKEEGLHGRPDEIPRENLPGVGPRKLALTGVARWCLINDVETDQKRLANYLFYATVSFGHFEILNLRIGGSPSSQKSTNSRVQPKLDD